MVKVNDLKYCKNNARISIGINDGCRFFQLEANKILETHRLIGEPVLYLSPLLDECTAIVTKYEPNVLKILNLSSKTINYKRNFGTYVLYANVIGDKLVVGLYSSIISTSLKDPKVEVSLTEVAPGYNGLIAMSTNPVKYMAFPSPKDGHVNVVNFQTNAIVTTINAHYRKISALSMNDTETVIATASEVGTVIRVFDLITGVKLKELRRGHSSSAQINSMIFSANDEFLTCASDRETIHVFRLVNSGISLSSCSTQESPTEQPTTETCVKNPSSWSLGVFSGMCESIYNSATYIPSVIESACNSERDFAVARFNCNRKCLQSKKVAFVTGFDNTWLLVVADFHGHIHYFKFDPVIGGECQLMSSLKLHEIPQGEILDVTSLSRFKEIDTPSLDVSTTPSSSKADVDEEPRFVIIL
nr:WD repeat domain phosphoinositide interacting [Hymenolepis microstoma]